MTENEEILATVRAAPGRRWMGVGALYLLAALVIYVALVTPPAPGWVAFLLGFGAVTVFLAERMRRLTSRGIELTREELRDTSGVLIARVAEMRRVERDAFAFKPSNGFLLHTQAKEGPRVWVPGLWWRVGRRIGVGGVAPGAQTKFMSEILSALIAEQEKRSE